MAIRGGAPTHNDVRAMLESQAPDITHHDRRLSALVVRTSYRPAAHAFFAGRTFPFFLKKQADNIPIHLRRQRHGPTVRSALAHLMAPSQAHPIMRPTTP